MESENHCSLPSSLHDQIICKPCKNPNHDQSLREKAVPVMAIFKKRKAGRKKFKETRHPVYRGVRRRNGNKWVCEVREPNKKSRIWVGTFSSPELAARAHDVAVLTLRGESAALNFPDSASILPRPKSSSASDIQKTALASVHQILWSSSSSSSCNSSSSSAHDDHENYSHVRSSITNLSITPVMTDLSLESKNQKHVLDRSLSGKQSVEIAENKVSYVSCSMALPCPNYGPDRNISNLSSTDVNFFDEEALFDMPGLIDSMAEGLLLTPPARRTGFDWDESAYTNETTGFTLWGDYISESFQSPIPNLG